MAGVPHDLVVLALRDRPELLSCLLERVAGARLSGRLEVVDSAVRFAASLETRPDLLFSLPSSGSDPSPWLMVEVQNRKDEQKGRSWHLSTSVLLQQGGMGDLVVVTSSRSVARWASRVAHHRGVLGTRKRLSPVVLHLSKDHLASLLDPAAPELALFAVWARCRGAGPEAKRVALRALEVSESLPEGLREAQVRAILAMLGERLLRVLKETIMDVTQIPETKASRAFRLFYEERGRAMLLAKRSADAFAEGQRGALLAVLAARGLAVTEAERSRIEAISDPAALDEHIRRAATARTVAEVLAPGKPTRNGRSRRAARKSG